MSKFQFKLNINGLRELMKSDEMKSCLQEAGDKVAGNGTSLSGGGAYGTRVHDANYVSICNVYPDDEQAAKDNRANNTALKALSASGLPMNK